MNVEQGIAKLRGIVAEIAGDEETVLDALVDLSDEWKMRLQELRDEREDGDR